MSELSIQAPQLRREMDRLSVENEQLKPLKSEAAKARSMLADSFYNLSVPVLTIEKPNGREQPE